MLKEITPLLITEFHDKKLFDVDWLTDPAPESHTDTWRWIENNHRYNALLWNEEDKARRIDVDAAEIAASKHLIDQYNQKRNDAVELIDEAILSELNTVAPSASARLNSETVGAMIDRLSILSLKIFHMREQTFRMDAGEQHIATCQAKLQRLKTQRQDLAACLEQLLADAADGRAYFKVYRQFKMYNDPTLNPYLYGTPLETAQTEKKKVPR